MLFWSFVLAFVLSILYYLSPVHNVVQVEDKPLADTLVSTFVNVHQAAKRLTYTDMADKKTIIKQCVDIDSDGKSFSVDCIDAEGNPMEIEVEDTSKRVITFTYKQAMAGLTGGSLPSCSSESKVPACIFNRILSEGIAIINPGEIKKILPWVKYRDDDNSLDVLDMYNITSAFACIKAGETPSLTFDCQGGKSGGIGDYVITYMQAPHSDGIGRNELWRSGILRRTKGSHECGVLWKTNAGKIMLTARKYNDDGDIEEFQRAIDIEARKRYDENSPYIMDNSRRFTLSVPTLIGKVIEESPDNVDADGNGKKDITEDMESGYLLFCITPIDDIKASFIDKCKRGYGKYIIKEKTDSSTENELLDCRDTITE